MQASERFARFLRHETRELLRLVEDTTLTELTVELDGTRIVIRREVAAEPAALVESAAAQASAEPAPAPELHTVTAPVVGKFYLSEEVGAALRPGRRIEVGDQLGIIESMRVPHEVHAGVAGEVVEVLVRDGQPVEYGQPLFVLRTAPAVTID